MVEEGGADVVEVPQQSEEAAAQLVVPNLCNREREPGRLWWVSSRFGPSLPF